MLGSDLLTVLSEHYKVLTPSLDITNAVECEKTIRLLKPDIVINAAAYTKVDLAEVEREKCFAVNATGVKNLVLSCEEHTKLVHFSTDYVFDGSKLYPYDEIDFCRPLNVYGKSKWEGETYIYSFKKNHIVIRTAWLFGKNGKNFISTILQKAKAGEKMKVVVDQIGSPTYTKDLAEATKVLIDRGSTGIFNITNSGFCNWHTLASFAVDCAKIKCEIAPIKTSQIKQMAQRPEIVVLDRKKFLKETNHSMRLWRKAVEDYVKEII